MKKTSVLQHLSIDYFSATPKYLQLANAIIKAIGDGKIGKGELLPSINELSFEFEIARDTAEKGYKYLKKIDVNINMLLRDSIIKRGVVTIHIGFEKAVMPTTGLHTSSRALVISRPVYMF